MNAKPKQWIAESIELILFSQTGRGTVQSVSFAIAVAFFAWVNAYNYLAWFCVAFLLTQVPCSFGIGFLSLIILSVFPHPPLWFADLLGRFLLESQTLAPAWKLLARIPILSVLGWNQSLFIGASVLSLGTYYSLRVGGYCLWHRSKQSEAPIANPTLKEPPVSIRTTELLNEAIFTRIDTAIHWIRSAAEKPHLLDRDGLADWLSNSRINEARQSFASDAIELNTSSLLTTSDECENWSAMICETVIEVIKLRPKLPLPGELNLNSAPEAIIENPFDLLEPHPHEGSIKAPHLLDNPSRDDATLTNTHDPYELSLPLYSLTSTKNMSMNSSKSLGSTNTSTAASTIAPNDSMELFTATTLPATSGNGSEERSNNDSVESISNRVMKKEESLRYLLWHLTCDRSNLGNGGEDR